MKYLELTKSIKLALMATFTLTIVLLIQEQYLGACGWFWAFLLILKVSVEQKMHKLYCEDIERKKKIIEKLMALTGYFN